MKRNLLPQMTYEWRNNIWLILGLTIASLAIWYFCLSVYSIGKNYFLPMGFDGEDVYVMKLGTHFPGSPNYVDEGEHTREMDDSDKKLLLAKIRSNPNVEAAGFSINGSPYQNSFEGMPIRLARPTVDSVYYLGNFRHISPEVVRVLRLESRTGEDADYLQQKLEEGEILVGHVDKDRLSDYYKDGFRLAEELYGQYVCSGDTTVLYHVADVINKVRRNTYENMSDWGDIIFPIDENAFLGEVSTIMVRVKPGCGDKFLRDYVSDPDLTTQRNIYVTKCTGLSDLRKSVERNNDMQVRMYMVLICFMVIIIFLGLLGTFWFRVQQRVSEIAIRRVCGASRGDIFRRLIGEGLLLLIGASILTAIIGWILIEKLDYDEKFTRMELAWLEAATFILVIVGIILSILAPARLAMRINPAEAVKEE